MISPETGSCSDYSSLFFFSRNDFLVEQLVNSEILSNFVADSCRFKILLVLFYTKHDNLKKKLPLFDDGRGGWWLMYLIHHNFKQLFHLIK